MSAKSHWVYWWKLIVLARAGIRAQRLRAFLSASGVTVGIAAVITILAIGEGARKEMLEQLRYLGTNSIIVKRVETAEGAALSSRTRSGLVMNDGDRIRNVLPQVTAVAPLIDRWTLARVQGREVRARLVGVTPESVKLRRLELESGRFLHEADSRARSNVCVLGAAVRQRLFGLGNPVGKGLKVGRDWFQVVGVLKERASMAAKRAIVRSHDINQNIYVPLEIVAPPMAVEEEWPISELRIIVANEARVLETAHLAGSVLARSHRGQRDYEVIVPLELIKQRQRSQMVFNSVLAGIAALSLLVGGIGIMNIMLATVTERTREIGVRRAVGATERDIAAQFLIETATLSFLGGLAGVVLGVLSSWLLESFWRWPVSISFTTTGIVLAVSVICGLIFGLYPALRAAGADPIDSLRYE